jgi:hypothetical protein
MAARIPWYRKKRWWALIAAPIVLFVVVLVAFDPLVEYIARKKFSQVKGYDITFEDASLQPTRLNAVLTRLKVMKRSAGGSKEPFLYFDKLQFGLHWRELLHGNLVASVEMDRAKVNLIAAKKKEDEQLSELPDLAKQLNALSPLRIDRVQVRKGELQFLDKTEPEVPKMWLHQVEATAENISTRAALARGEPTVIALSGRLQKEGELSAWITADPLAKGLWFSGRVRAEGIELKEFHKLLASKSGLALDQGTLDLFAEFDARGDHISGGVKPVLKNPHVIQAEPGAGNWLKKTFADAALKLFSDRVPGRNAVATTIPINGRVDQPDVDLWPTVLGVVRNAFVEGVSESFELLPPPQAEKSENIVKQAVDALDKGKAAPRAQPDEKARQGDKDRAARKAKPNAEGRK